MRRCSFPLAQAWIFLALAGLCALISNALAGPSRHLGWRDRPTVTALNQPAVTLAAPVPQPTAEPVPLPSKPPATTQPAAPSQPAKPARFIADPAQPIRDISPEEAWALYQAKAPFLDARRSAAYTEGHIAGAWNVPIWEANGETGIAQFEAAAHPGARAPLVIYCSGGDCEDSRLLAARLIPLGYRNLFLYQGGYPDWEAQGRPIRKGVQP